MNPGTDWIDSARRVLDALGAGQQTGAPDDGTPSGSHSADCRWCPVCQVAAVVRGERPEVTAALADVLTTAAAALREFATDLTPPEKPAADEPADEPAEPSPVQRIDIA